jgi:hypothetical protein
MTTITVTGWDGANPLHFLAALGTLVLVAEQDPDATLAWRWEGRWIPIITHRHSAWPDDAAAAAALTALLRALGATGSVDPGANRRVRDLKQRVGDLQKERKSRLGSIKADKSLDKAARAAALQAAAMTSDAELRAAEKELERAQADMGDALGAGIAHLGSVIGVQPDIFRRQARSACDAWLAGDRTRCGAATPDLLAAALAAQSCDGVHDDRGMVAPTPLSFGNGAGNQWLLLAFRNCCGLIDEAMFASLMAGAPVAIPAKAVSVGWNPAEQRDYALQWDDPAGGNAHDVATNAIAFVGLSRLTAFPSGTGGSRMGAMCWTTSPEHGLIWPLWDVPLSIPALSSLLACDLRHGPRRPGVSALMHARRITVNKRYFFAPARPL